MGHLINDLSLKFIFKFFWKFKNTFRNSSDNFLKKMNSIFFRNISNNYIRNFYSFFSYFFVLQEIFRQLLNKFFRQCRQHFIFRRSSGICIGNSSDNSLEFSENNQVGVSGELSKAFLEKSALKNIN